VTDYLTSTFAAPFLFVMEPAAGADALANGIVGLGFYIALALIVGWCLHCIVVLLVPALRRGAGPEPNQPRQPTAAPPRATPP